MREEGSANLRQAIARNVYVHEVRKGGQRREVVNHVPVQIDVLQEREVRQDVDVANVCVLQWVHHSRTPLLSTDDTVRSVQVIRHVPCM